MTDPQSTETTPAKPGRRRQAVARVTRTARSARETVTTRVKDAADTVSTRVKDAAGTTTQALDANPFGAIAGAIAVGAVAAAMIPATRRELNALGPWSERMRDQLGEAFEAAKTAGGGELTAAGLTFAAASTGVGGIVGTLVKAATAATAAAASSARNKSAKAEPVEITPTI